MQYFQCSKCKRTKAVRGVFKNRTVLLMDGRRVRKRMRDNDKLPQIKCCDRVMREISAEDYRSEGRVNDAGLRG